MGHGAVYDLAHNSPAVESITVADFDPAKAEAVRERGRQCENNRPPGRCL